MIEISKEAARKYLMVKQGLINPYKFKGKQGIMDFFKQAGCIQFDPIDICGRNADLVLFSRVSGYKKHFLDELLYQDRMLVDQWDKMMSIYPVTDWHFMKRIRNMHAKSYEKHLINHKEDLKIVEKILENKLFVHGHGLNMGKDAEFFTWRHKNLGKAILDYLFFKGDAVVHHREGVKRFFTLSNKLLDKKYLDREDPFITDAQFHKFQLKRRISAVGMLQSQASDAYLGLYFNASERRGYLNELVEDQALLEISVKGIKDVFYILKEDQALLTSKITKKRIEFIAPLDNLIWYRKLISKVFDFEYRWEIYHMPEKRNYAPYALPILYGINFIGQIEFCVDRNKKVLSVKNIWYKKKEPKDAVKAMIEKKVRDFAEFNDCDLTAWDHTKVHVYE